MPRVYRTRQERERFIIRKFLCHLGYRVSSPSWPDRPDALVTLSKGRSKKRVAIEHTDYFNDTVAGQRSPLTVYGEFWELVQASLVRRISHRPDLTGISARVRLKKNLPKPENRVELARQLAKEIVDFTVAHPVRQSEHVPWDFDNEDHGYPTMQLLLASLLLSRGTNDVGIASRCAWICSNTATGHIALSLQYIKTAIAAKNKKAEKYTWDNVDEKWLLIAAHGATCSNLVGAPVHSAGWTDAKLVKLCRLSPFDRIIFWEGISGWYKWLKPDRRIVRYGNP